MDHQSKLGWERGRGRDSIKQEVELFPLKVESKKKKKKKKKNMVDYYDLDDILLHHQVLSLFLALNQFIYHYI